MDALRQRAFAPFTPICRSTIGRRTLEPSRIEAGVSEANSKEPAPTLIVTSSRDADWLLVDTEFRAPDGQLLSKGQARYRNGFIGEPMDDENAKGDVSSARFTFLYLLHNNVVNNIVGGAAAPTVASPVRTFLHQAALLSHPQDIGAPATPVEAVVYESKRFDPPRILHGDAGQTERSEYLFDKERDARCRTLMRPESDGPQAQVWWLFVNDPTGRRKARVTGPRLCDPDAIWLFDYTAVPGHAVLTKFDIEGNLRFRIAMKRSSDAMFIREPSLHSSGGILEFEWGTGSNQVSDFWLTEIDKVRIKEPA